MAKVTRIPSLVFIRTFWPLRCTATSTVYPAIGPLRSTATSIVYPCNWASQMHRD